MTFLRTGALLLRDVLLACLIVGTVVMILLVSSLEHSPAHPDSAVPLPPGGVRSLIRANSAAAAGAKGGRGGLLVGGGGARGAAPGPVPWPRPFVPAVSATPSAPPDLPRMYDLRNCECVVNGEKFTGRLEGRPSSLGKAPAACTCNDGACPADVTIGFLTEAIGQDVCSLRRYTGYGCTVGCHGVDAPVSWYGHTCWPPGAAGERPAGVRDCAPLILSPTPSPTPSMTLRPAGAAPEVTWDPEGVVDLRGLQCEIQPGGKEACFSEDSQGRTLCPEFVTSAYLRDPPASGPHAVGGDIVEQCGPRFAKTTYCTAHCQPGNDRVQWWTHDYTYCYSKDGAWACPSMRADALVPKERFTVKPWSEPSPSNMPCRVAAEMGAKPGRVEGLSVGLLTHEPTAFAKSMATYEALGFFDVVPEFIIYMNGRHPGLEAVVEPYAKKHPGLFKLLGNATNLGIAAGMVELTNAASHPNFLFMERDFWLVEPATCVAEQLRAGIALLDTREVHVVRYRHRIKAGRPNWAENFFKGHEDDAFVGRQPNLACNIFYWVPDVVARWPAYFQVCGKDPEMVCSDAFYCNWTNNPQMWRLDWWQKEYVDLFPKFNRNDPWYDLGACCPPPPRARTLFTR
jgi:hypothetical protein